MKSLEWNRKSESWECNAGWTEDLHSKQSCSGPAEKHLQICTCPRLSGIMWGAIWTETYTCKKTMSLRGGWILIVQAWIPSIVTERCSSPCRHSFVLSIEYHLIPLPRAHISKSWQCPIDRRRREVAEEVSSYVPNTCNRISELEVTTIYSVVASIRSLHYTWTCSPSKTDGTACGLKLYKLLNAGKTK